jgi:gluconate 2-dehydrogenase gamma chain
MPPVSRRAFLQAAGTAAAAPAIALGAPAKPATAAHDAQLAYTFLNPHEAAFIEAAVARLIPKDELGAGALEAGVPHFIDRQLGGAWGAGERLNRTGPFASGTPSQGYQLPFTPAELFRRAMRALEQERGANAFARDTPEAQDAFLTALTQDKRDLDGVPSDVFFQSLLEVTIEGFFCDPVYGGNRDMVAWEMIGFPGAYADYYDLVDQHGLAYTRKPMSLAQDGRGQVHMQPVRANAAATKGR